MSTEAIEGFRLSPGQRHVWRCAGEGTAASLRTHGVLAIDGTFDHAALGAAWSALLERHEVLRTRLERLPGVALPVQAIAEQGGDLLDLSGEFSGLERAALAEALLSRAEGAELDWDGAKPAWAAHAVAADGTHLVAVALPGTVLDGASLGTLADELTALVGGDSPAEEALQYADISEWLNELVEGEESAEGRAFWNGAGVPADPSWELPNEKPTKGSAIHAEDLSRSVLDLGTAGGTALSEAAKTAGVEREPFLLALWQTFLARLSGQDEFLLGVWSDGRGYEELHGAVGLFARDLPLWVAFDGAESLASLAGRHAARLGELRPWQEAFAWEALDRPASTSQNAFSASFAYCEQAPRVVASSGFTELTALRLVATARGAEISLAWIFDGARFAAGDIDRMAAEFLTLVRDACEHPKACVSELALVPADERAFLLGEASTTAPVPCEFTLAHQMIGAHCQSNPEAVAAFGEGGDLTYGELDRRANALAHVLVERGALADSRVALSVERSPELLVAILGILRAGGGYVPIDPTYPEERVAFLMGDSGAKVLVTTRKVGEALPSSDLDSVFLDDLGEGADSPPAESATADSLAYVIYTSGSTGKPKGVEITHGNLVHSTNARSGNYPEAPERFLLVSSFAFDSSIVGLFWTLASGGALILPADGDERDARILMELIEKHSATTTLMLPSLYGLLLEQPNQARLDSLRDVIVAGEACQRELVERHRAARPNTRLWNEYGPTENTVWSTVFDCGTLPADGPVPIGRPTPGACVRILDAGQNLVPIGAPGELYVGGPGVARGYLDRPDVTAERFIADPLAEDSAGRLYRTGDRVRFTPEGELHFLGRVDHQVKVRGYRIELEEIEAVLGADAEVSEACVVARDKDGVTSLVAYLVGKTNELAADRIADELRSRLPEYMVPGAWVVLDSMPQTPNGKIDRKALPAPEEAGGRAGLTSEYVAPKDPLEEAIAALWADVLGAGDVGVEDNFFELGGHSILAVRLVTRMGESFQIDVGLRQLFDAPTIAGLLTDLCSNAETAATLQRVSELLVQMAGLSDDEVDRRLDAGA